MPTVGRFARALLRILAAIWLCAPMGCTPVPPMGFGRFDRTHTVEPLHLTEQAPPKQQTESDQTKPPESAEPQPEVIPAPTPQGTDVKLEEARAAALENNLNLRVQLVDPAIAKQAVNEQAGVFQPTFRFSVGRNQTNPPPGNFLFPAQEWQTVDLFNPFAAAGFGGSGSPAIDMPLTTGGKFSLETGVGRLDATGRDEVYDTNVGVSFSQPLLRGAGRNVNTANIQIADFQRGISHARTKLAVIRLLADVERAYWNLYSTLKSREIARQQVEIAEQQLKISRRLIEAEQISAVDGLRAESGLYARRAVAVAAETNVYLAARELKRIMHRPDLPVNSQAALSIATDPAPKALQLDRAQLVQYAIGNRMELMESQLDLLRNAVELAVQENAVLPKLDLVSRFALLGSDKTLGDSYGRLFGEGFNDWFVGLVTEVPLPFGSGNRTAVARREQVLLQRVKTRVSQADLRQIIGQEVYNAADKLEQNYQRILVARQAVLAADKTSQAERRLFENGQRNSTDVLFAAQQLGEAQTQEVAALVDFELAKVDLAVATGTVLGADQVQWKSLGCP